MSTLRKTFISVGVAIKTAKCKPEDYAFVNRFLREARAASILSHQHIATGLASAIGTIYVGTSDQRIYGMERQDGYSQPSLHADVELGTSTLILYPYRSEIANFWDTGGLKLLA